MDSKLMRRLARIERAMKNSSQPQLANSSIEDGALQSNQLGTLNLIIGQQHDGTQTVAVVNGPPPPQPNPPLVQGGIDGATVLWDGLWVDNAVTPMNFGRVEAHASVDPGFLANSADTLIGFYESPRGGRLYPRLPANTYTIKFVAVSQSGVRGAASSGVEVTITDLLHVIGTPDLYTPDAPTESPDVTVTPSAQGFTLRVDDADPTVQVSYYATEQTGGLTDFTVGPSNLLLGPTRRNPVYLDGWPDGSKFDPTKSYLFKTVASNIVDSAPPSPAVESALSLIGSDAVSSIDVGKLASGSLEAAIALIGSLQVGTSITIDPDSGITITLAGGGVIRFPSDGTDAIITAVLRARSLIVENHLTIYGPDNLLYGGMTAANGVAAPTTPPSAGPSWDHAAAYTNTDVATIFAGNVFGLWDDTTGWVTCRSFFDGWIDRIDKTTGATTNLAGPITGFQPTGGVVKVGTDWYVLAYRNSDATWWVRKYNSSWVFQSTWQFNFADTGGLNPAIGTDGTSIYIGRMATPTSGPGGRLVIRKFSTSGAHDASALTNTTATDWVQQNLTGLYVGSADLGITRRIAMTTTKTMVVNTTTGSRVAGEEWVRANNSPVSGLSWDGTRFHTLDTSTGRVWHYGRYPIAITRTITYDKFNSTLGWTTQASPPVIKVQQPRQWVAVETAPPGNGGQPDDPDSVRIYVNDHRQATLAPGDTDAIYDLPDLAGAAASLTNTFPPLAAPGYYKSEAEDSNGPLTFFPGDGSYRLAGDDLDDAGWITVPALSGFVSTCQVRMKNGMIRLRGSFTPTSGNFAASSNVNVGTIPVNPAGPGWRPPQSWAGQVSGGNSASSHRCLITAATGVITLNTSATATSSASMDQVSYFPD